MGKKEEGEVDLGTILGIVVIDLLPSNRCLLTAVVGGLSRVRWKSTVPPQHPEITRIFQFLLIQVHWKLKTINIFELPCLVFQLLCCGSLGGES